MRTLLSLAAAALLANTVATVTPSRAFDSVPAPGEFLVATLHVEVTASRGQGLLSGVTTIHRLNTTGGMAQGPCLSAGKLKSVPYSADYALIRRGP